MPTVWANGRVVGAWGRRKACGEPFGFPFDFTQGRAQDRPRRTNGNVIYGLFEPVGEEERVLLEREIQRLEGFLGGEFLPPRTHTSFTRALS